MSKETLVAALAPIFEQLADVTPAEPGLAARLNEVLPLDGEVCRAVLAVAEEGVADGWLCGREAGGIHFSRPVKPSPASHDFSVDAVVMDNVRGPKHTHTNGEINLCFAQEGDPKFDGHPAGWVVFPPGSTHVPSVKDGKMLILYFLPQGAIEFVRD